VAGGCRRGTATPTLGALLTFARPMRVAFGGLLCATNPALVGSRRGSTPKRFA
jgi:hypothetical protein